MKPDPAAIQEYARKKGIRYSDARSLLKMRRERTKPAPLPEPSVEVAAILKIIDKTLDEAKKLLANARECRDSGDISKYSGAVAAANLIQERVRQHRRLHS